MCLHSYFFFFNDTATTEIYTLSLHDALPIFFKNLSGIITLIFCVFRKQRQCRGRRRLICLSIRSFGVQLIGRSEEHTSELQSRQYLVCRLLLEKKNRDLSLKAHISE